MKFKAIFGDCYVKAIGQRDIRGEYKKNPAYLRLDTGTNRSQIASFRFPSQPQYLLAHRDGPGNIFVNDLVGLQKVFNVSYEEFFKDIPPSRSSKQSP